MSPWQYHKNLSSHNLTMIKEMHMYYETPFIEHDLYIGSWCLFPHSVLFIQQNCKLSLNVQCD